MIGIIGAMEIEIASLVDILTEKKEITVGKLLFTHGKYSGKEVVVVKCGIGKVFAASAATAMILTFPNIKLIINLGVAGGLHPALKQGDFAVAQHSVQHDYDLTPEGLPIGNVAGYDNRNFACDKTAVQNMCSVLEAENFIHKKGVIVSGDQFIACDKKTAWLKKEFSAIACDMETASIAQVCDLFSIAFLGVRAISDNASEGAALDFNAFCAQAAKRSIAAVKQFLKSM